LVAGLDILPVHDRRVDGRINWIGRKLGEGPSFSVEEKQSLARRPDWPMTASAAEERWRLRHKAECRKEILNGQSGTVARSTVLRRYEGLRRHRVDLNPTERAERFLSVVGRLFDPPTNYFSAETFSELGRGRERATIRLVFDDDGTGMWVKEVTAEASGEGGLRPGGRLISMAEGNGRPVGVAGMTPRTAMNRLTAAAGTKTALIVAPSEATGSVPQTTGGPVHSARRMKLAQAQLTMIAPGKTRLVVITRRAPYRALDSTNGARAPSSPADVAGQQAKAQKSRMAGLLLDLRGNGGGYLTAATEIVRLFVGPRLITRVRNSNRARQEDRSRHGAL
jgi:carboxyl-terminal processing protease